MSTSFNATPSVAPIRLTAAEVDVLAFMLRGCTNKEIALSRQTSPRTVANQVVAIFRKFGVYSRRELAAKRALDNILPPEFVLSERAALPITIRERQVTRSAGLGHSNKWIACELGLATSTIAGHLKNAARKLGARSGIDLVRSQRA